MQYLVIWNIQGNSMSDSGQTVLRNVEAENLSDLYNILHDRNKFSNRWGEPSEVYEVSNRFTQRTFMEEIHKEVMSNLR